MSNTEVKKFQLNNKALDDFEKIMSTKLDEIEELTVTGVDQNSKLFNIISLCANVKTLIIEGDQRINSDKILLNIFKPDKLENLIINNVKLPTESSLKKYTNLKTISLNDIRFCNIKNFLESINNPENIENINISNTDMANNSISIINKFCNFKYLKLQNLQNCKFDNLCILKKNDNILKVDITKNKIYLSEVNNILKCSGIKNIDVEIIDNNKDMKNCKLKICNTNNSIIEFSVEDLENVNKNVKLYKVDKINCWINSIQENAHYIKVLKKLRKDIEIYIDKITCLKIEELEKMKEFLKIEKINLYQNEVLKEISIDNCIEVINKITELVSGISKHVSEIEKFLEIYKIIGEKFECSEKNDILDLSKNICGKKAICEFLKECLNCINIKSNIIFGKDIETNQNHYWNQVELKHKWYNVDIVLDMDNIKDNKVEYCLLGDENFHETHMPENGQNSYCSEDYNQKLIYVFFKTGLFKENLFSSYFQVAVEKVKNKFEKKND